MEKIEKADVVFNDDGASKHSNVHIIAVLGLSMSVSVVVVGMCSIAAT
ncbi:protein of unknown function [Pseudodesulfovibrio profundus]|uniref:Transmembrane protein n=1 Tax=Pseudodesulfovibrio profundus TaxID=57320 RepID=A0A2C8F2Y7_9BACT|nr:protein of unknown function [Pseudodesulfovibrio profundus]